MDNKNIVRKSFIEMKIGMNKWFKKHFFICSIIFSVSSEQILKKISYCSFFPAF